MNVRLSSVAIFAGLVATPAANLHAQSNPWYIPPQAPAQAPTQAQPGYRLQPGFAMPSGTPVQHGAPQLVPQVYVQTPPYGLGAGYTVPQPQAPATILVPQTVAPYPYAVPSSGYAQRPATTGTVASAPTIAPVPAYGASAPHEAAPTPVPPQQPAFVYVVPQQQPATAQAYTYQPQVQVFGNYAPLGIDPTMPAGQATRANPQPPPAAPSSAPLTAPNWGAPSALQYPEFTGPTTLSPGLGAYPGLPSTYGAPYGATPYLGLPFY